MIIDNWTINHFRAWIEHYEPDHIDCQDTEEKCLQFVAENYDENDCNFTWRNVFDTVILKIR